MPFLYEKTPVGSRTYNSLAQPLTCCYYPYQCRSPPTPLPAHVGSTDFKEEIQLSLGPRVSGWPLALKVMRWVMDASR